MRRPHWHSERGYGILPAVRRRALGALLLIFVATPIPALCAVCMPEGCPMDRVRAEMVRARSAPAMEEAGCHGMTHGAVPDATLGAVRPDCCVAAAAQEEAVAVPATTPDAPLPAPVENEAPTPAPRPSPTLASACESPPPEPLRPLYTLHSTLLI